MIRNFILKFIKFGIVGFSGMIVDYGVLFILKEIAGMAPLLANTISFIAAATSNYLFNRIWTFKSKERNVGKEFGKFFIVSVIGLGINNLTLYIAGLMMPEWNEDWRFYLLKLLAIVVTTIWNFFGNLLYTFRNKKREPDHKGDEGKKAKVKGESESEAIEGNQKQ